MISTLSLVGKRALVGGSSEGIGKAVAIELAKLGAEVIVISRNEEKLKSVVKELNQLNKLNNSYLIADYSIPATLEEAVSDLINNNKPVHILINNTGGPPGGPANEAGIQEFYDAFRNHLICNQMLLKLVLPGMKKEKYGRVINIISTSVKQPIPNLGVSNTIRGAVANWAKTLANELGQYGITVNNVLPGMTKTQRLVSIVNTRAEKQNVSVETIENELLETIPARRFAEAAELGYATAFLASPAASYINGVNLPVDGGRIKSL
ncbi:MAG: SDR family oxidoreductase [Candidatus Heimdallarchaeota archaeon]|nr:SDR family oxidoreductase [Candidatus Heimdallarchaeota archaeon]